MSIRILLVDDHEIMREGLCALLRKHEDMEVVGKAGDGRCAIRMAEELKPDVVIMDISMPNLNGFDATSRVLGICPDVKVLALSTYSDRANVTKMLKAGASGYMLKDSTFKELVKGIKAIKDGKTFLCSRASGVVLDDYMSMLSNLNEKDSDRLTSREREVLQLVAEGKASKRIAAILHLSVKTVDSHRAHIMEKLGVHNTVELAKYAIREGLTSL